VFSNHIHTPEIKLIASIADELNIDTYIVGGFVRDIFLKRDNKDIDFVCIGKGIHLAEKVAERLGSHAHLSVFKNFGTANIRFHAFEFEFVGARKESYSRDSRKPIVEDGTLEDDQNRRDFTINAMAIGLNQHNFGQLLDPFNGVQDIDNKILKTPLDPNITFSDDPLRMMRAVRFATQLQFHIEEKTYQALHHNAVRLEIISQERITDELNKIILSKVPSIGFKHLFDTGLLHQFFPEMVALQGTETVNGKSHKDNFYHTLEVLDNTCNRSTHLWLRWAAILHDIAKPATKRFEEGHGFTFHGHEDKGARMVPKIFAKLRLPLDHQMKYVQKLVQLHLRPIVLSKEEITDSAIRRLLFDAGEDIDDLMRLCESDITTKSKTKMERYLQNFEIVREKLKVIEEKDKIRNWQPPIDGAVIMQTFNIPAGREVGVIKTAIREAILDGVITNDYEAAFQFMLEQGKVLGMKAV
jgi:poly(A) polymerase